MPEKILRPVLLTRLFQSCRLSQSQTHVNNYFLSGGFCDSELMLSELSKRLKAEVKTHPYARYAGAVGAALLTK